MVLAVNMPAQLPIVGQALRSMRASSSSVSVPAARAPTASKTLTMSRASPWGPRPGRMLPAVEEDRRQVEAGRGHRASRAATCRSRRR